ncbi:MAG: hypothetical protein RSC80_08665 [Odoribacter sp.]
MFFVCPGGRGNSEGEARGKRGIKKGRKAGVQAVIFSKMRRK